MIYLILMWVFAKIALFSFGGGYAMISLIQKEIESRGWVEAGEFADIVAISQMTPGPIAINAATYIGMKTSGIIGSIFATFGICIPSFILIIAIVNFLNRFRDNRIVNSALMGIRPVTIGLIGSAAVFFLKMSVFDGTQISVSSIQELFAGNIFKIFDMIKINIGAALIFLIAIICSKVIKLHTILIILLSMLLGLIIS